MFLVAIVLLVLEWLYFSLVLCPSEKVLSMNKEDAKKEYEAF